MLLTPPKFAALLIPPVTKGRVYQWIERGDIIRENGHIDTENPVNKAWLSTYPHDPQPKPANTRSTLVSGIPMKKQKHPDAEPTLPDIEETHDAEELLAQVASFDLRKLNKATIDKIRVLEVALKTRVEREQRRGNLIDRSLVQVIFGKLYQIDTNEFRTMGAVLAPEVAGMLGVEDPEKVLKVEQMIDDEVIKILGHVHRLLNDALVKWGGEPL